LPNYNNLEFTPSDGYSNKEAYETRPASESRVREIFNSLPEQIKTYLNQQIVAKLNDEFDLLRSELGAAALGVAPLAAGYENKLQPALERLKTEINTAIMGQVPNGSITLEKLSADLAALVAYTAGVEDDVAQYTLFPSTMTAEEKTAFEADSEKMALYHASTPFLNGFVTGSYSGNDSAGEGAQREIVLGFRASAVLIFNRGVRTLEYQSSGDYYYYWGGLGYDGKASGGIDMSDNGFIVTNRYASGANHLSLQLNVSGESYHYMAWR
jgi:hypothetical protein